MTDKDIPAKIAPYVNGASVLVGAIYGVFITFITDTRSPTSVLHKHTFFELWVSSPYSSLAMEFIGLVWSGAWLLYRFERLLRWQRAILCVFLSGFAAIITVSLRLSER